jgi:UDP-glucose 4-epimerase
VSDTVDGFVRAATAELAPGEVVQLGTGTTVSVGDVVGLCRRVTGREDAEVIVEDERVRPEGSEVEVLLSDPEVARGRLGWTPTVEFEEGLRATAAWICGRIPGLRDSGRYVR